MEKCEEREGEKKRRRIGEKVGRGEEKKGGIFHTLTSLFTLGHKERTEFQMEGNTPHHSILVSGKANKQKSH